jgi:hypothetical protein
MVMKSFTMFFERYKPLVIAMVKKIKAPRGSHRRTTIDGVEYTLASYCKAVYGVSYRHVHALIEGEYVPVPNEEGADDAKSAADVEEGNGEHTECKCDKIPCECQPVVTDTDKPSKKDEIIRELRNKNDSLMESLAGLQDEMDALKQAPPSIRDMTTQGEAESEDPESGFTVALEYFRGITDPTSFASDIDAIIRKCGMSEYIKTVMTDTAEAI